MSKREKKQKEKRKRPTATPSFQVTLPVEVDEQQAKALAAHFEMARHLYNAILSEGLKRLKRMRADSDWQATRTIPHSQKAERNQAYKALREKHGFSDYALQQAVSSLRVGDQADHVEAVVAQVLATRAYRALNRVAIGQAKRVRFRSQGRGLGSVENKRNDTGLRFGFLDLPAPPGAIPVPTSASPVSKSAAKRARRARNQKAREDKRRGGARSAGFIFWQGLSLRVRIDWDDPVVAHALSCRVKYIRLLQNWTSSPRACGADAHSLSYSVQLVVEGTPLRKPKHQKGQGQVGVDLGPSCYAAVPEAGAAHLEEFCADLSPKAEHGKKVYRLQRKMDRQRRAANPDNYDERGRVKKNSRSSPLHWKNSQGYRRTRRQSATAQRKRAAHRKSLHGKLAHEIAAMGETIVIEKLSYRAWQKQFGRSVSERAPGMFVAQVKRTVASTGGTLVEVSTRTTRLSQFCHGCGAFVKKPLSQRVHVCACGIGPVQRDLYSAFLAAFLDVSDPDDPQPPSCARYSVPWESGEARLRVAHDVVQQRAKEGQHLPRSLGVPRAGVRRLESQSDLSLEPANALPLLWRRNRLEAGRMS